MKTEVDVEAAVGVCAPNVEATEESCEYSVVGIRYCEVLCSASEEGPYLRLIDFCIGQL